MGISNNDERIIDNQTGVEIHAYDDWFKLTRNGEVIAKMDDFGPQEQEVVWQIKQAITDPEVARKRKEEYPNALKCRREKLSNLFEYPEPIVSKTPVMEENTTDYQG